MPLTLKSFAPCANSAHDQFPPLGAGRQTGSGGRSRSFPNVAVVLLALLAGNFAHLLHAEPPATPPPATRPADAELTFEIQRDVPLKHDDGQFLWFHPRAAAIPSAGRNREPQVVVTLQKHLFTSDFYSGLSTLQTDDLGKTWVGPEPQSELQWTRDPQGVIEAVADVTPGYHPPSGKLLAVGARVRYSEQGRQLEDIPRAHQTAYAVYDPKAETWTKWRLLDLPADDKFHFARSACAQWLAQADGTVLLPFYFGPKVGAPFSVTVVQCSFDGEELTYLRHGSELSLDAGRGLYEPSLTFFDGRYYLTIRSDERGYVTVGRDGLDFEPVKPWTFDDGQDLGSYNTQQHWVAHSDALFLAYTRRGADNNHVFRHRAPLFIARVDPQTLQVLRGTEQVLIPERGATLGNFGAAAITENESWVTVSEGVWNDDIRRRGAEGATFVARILWSKPNQLAPGVFVSEGLPRK